MLRQFLVNGIIDDHRMINRFAFDFGCHFCVDSSNCSRASSDRVRRPWDLESEKPDLFSRFSCLFMMRLVCLSFSLSRQAFRKQWISRWNAKPFHSTNRSSSLIPDRHLGVLLRQTWCGSTEHRQVLQGAELRGKRTRPEADRLPDHARWQPGAQRREGTGDPELGQRFERWVLLASLELV